MNRLANKIARFCLIAWILMGPASWLHRASAEESGEVPGPGVSLEDGPDGQPFLTVEQLRGELGYVWHTLQAPWRGIQVVVHYLPGDELWAETTLQTALTALPLLERVTGEYLPRHRDVHFWETRERDIGLSGINLQDGGILLSRSGDVVIHELAHYWVGAHNLAEHWMAEGLADLYDHLVHLQLDGLVWSPPDLSGLRRLQTFDGPLTLWQRVDRMDATVQEREVNRFFYGKSFMFWYSLYRVHGPAFIKDLQRWTSNGQSPRDAADLIAFLSAPQRRSSLSVWDLYPGWLVQGDYRLKDQPYTFQWYLEDDDDDGVVNLEEMITGLNPDSSDTDRDGLGDGWELYASGRPLKPDPYPDDPGQVWVLPQWTPTSTHRFVRAGETIQIDAEGFWRMAEPSRTWFGPDGAREIDVPQGRWGELLAQVGWGPRAGRVRTIGVSGSFVADRDGILYLFARGYRRQIGRGQVLATIEGGRPLPGFRPGSRALRNQQKICRQLRSQGVTSIELAGKHVTLVLHPSDLSDMTNIEGTLAYLDQVYGHYRKMLGVKPYGGRPVSINFDLTTRDQIAISGNAMVLTFGFDHYKALLRTTFASYESWGLTYGLALPFLEWFHMDRMLEGPALWALAEVMATTFYEKRGAEVPAVHYVVARQRSYQTSLRESPLFASDKHLMWLFMNSLRREFGWKTYRRMLEANGSLDVPQATGEVSDVPFEDFLLAFGRSARVNLIPRYSAWGFPTTGRIRQALEGFPLPDAEAVYLEDAVDHVRTGRGAQVSSQASPHVIEYLNFRAPSD